jgi:hypothetical protein
VAVEAVLKKVLSKIAKIPLQKDDMSDMPLGFSVNI